MDTNVDNGTKLNNHKIFNRLRHPDSKKYTLEYYNYLLGKTPIEQRTEEYLLILANASMQEGKRKRSLDNAKKYNSKRKEVLEADKSTELIEHLNKEQKTNNYPKERKKPDLTPGVSIYKYKTRVVKSDGTIVERDMYREQERKGSTYGRMTEETKQEIYDNYLKENCIIKRVAENYKITPYMVRKIRDDFEKQNNI